MEKRVGTSAGLLALLAFLIHTLLPPSSERVTEPANGAAKASASLKAHNGSAVAKPVPEEGPWVASRQYFHQELETGFESTCLDYLLPPMQEKTACDPSQLETLYGLDASFDQQQLQTLIATIPDPLHTRLSLETDRYLDAIREGAFEAGWEMATQWLPWTEKMNEANEAGGEGSQLDLEKMPGLIVFRKNFNNRTRADQVLFVFVVGETPTAGINGYQFEAARRSIETLSKEAMMRVLGPVFSGSFLSLAKLIRDDKTQRAYQIHSGSVSNSNYAVSMLQLQQTPGGSRKVEFHGSTIPSISFAAQFEGFARQEGYEAGQIAELVEDDSGFSEGVTASLQTSDKLKANQNLKIVTYRYPRDIAQLREAYSDVAFSSQADKGGAASQTIQFSLKDTQSGEGDFPMYSTSHTPVSQDSILEDIVGDIKRKKLRLISLNATNIFDTLFLASVLRKECPNLRIVVSGADLLFVQAAAQQDLSGIISISTFPMFPAGFEWANGGKHLGTSFPDADSVGVFNAALTLLDGKPEQTVRLAPALPGSDPSTFSDWLLVLGRFGWTPVDLLNQHNSQLDKLGKHSWFLGSDVPVLKANADVDRGLKLPPAPVAFTIICLAVAAFSLVFCGRWLYLLAQPKLRNRSILCSFELWPLRELCRTSMSRFICLTGCFASLCFANGLLLIPMTPSVVDWWLPYFTNVACGVPFLAMVAVLVGTITARNSDVSRRFRGAVILISALLPALTAGGLFVWHQLCFQYGARGPFFRFRVLSLAFPVSPLWPVLLAAVAYFIVSFFHLRRLTWAHREKPALPTQRLDIHLWGRLGDAYDEMDRVLSGPARTRLKTRLTIFAIIGSVTFLLLTLMRGGSLKSFENSGYQNILVALFLPLTMFVTGGLIRFALGWKILSGMLTMLHSLDLGRFFGRLADFEGNGPIWSRDLKLMSLATSINSWIALHNLVLNSPAKTADPGAFWKNLSAFFSPTPPRDRNLVLEQYRDLSNESARIGNDLVEKVLEPYWAKYPIGFVQQAASKPAAMVAAAGGAAVALQATPQPPEMEQEAYKMASRFVALQYSIFIGYSLRQIQNLLICSVFGFVLLVLALNSFSFQAPQTISRLTIAALIVGGALVVRVLAQVERNPIISRLSGTTPGTLSKDFYFKVLAYGALPVLTVLGTQFPSVAHFLTSFAEPAIEALK